MSWVSWLGQRKEGNGWCAKSNAVDTLEACSKVSKLGLDS